MLKYQIINKEESEIYINLINFPQELVDFLKKEKIYNTAVEIFFGIIENRLYIDNIRGSSGIPASIIIPLPNQKDNPKRTGPHHGSGKRPSVVYTSPKEGAWIASNLTVAFNELYRNAFNKESVFYALETIEEAPTMVNVL